MKKELINFTTDALYNNYVAGTLIPQAENFIDSYCGGRDGTLRRFNTNLGTWSQDGNGKPVIWFNPKWTPLMGTPTITVDGAAVAATAIKIHPDGGNFIQLDGASFTQGRMNVRVIGTHGYVTVPPDVSYVTGQLCANALLDMARRNTAEDVAGVGPGRLDFTTMFASPAIFASPQILTEPMRKVLEPYKVRWTDLG